MSDSKNSQKDAAEDIIKETIKTLQNNQIYKRQVKQMDLKNRLSEFSAQQAYDFKLRLQMAKTDEEKFNVIYDFQNKLQDVSYFGVENIKSIGVNQKKSNDTFLLIIFGVSIVGLGLFFIMKKK